jgi:deoxyribose-phosphate aldolase
VSTRWTRSAVAATIDHTLLKPEATDTDVARLVDEATELGVLAVCVSPARLPLRLPGSPRLPAPARLPGSPRTDAAPLVVATVCGFPSGASTTAVKAAEAAGAVAAGADEVDVVVDLGLVRAGLWQQVEDQLAAVRRACGPAALKVILESALLTDEELAAGCLAAERAGAAFVKTSTGFGTGGGATRHAVEVMAATVGGRLGIKASGGIRDAAAAVSMLDAGATRLGMSASRAVLDALPDT